MSQEIKFTMSDNWYDRMMEVFESKAEVKKKAKDLLKKYYVNKKARMVQHEFDLLEIAQEVERKSRIQEVNDLVEEE